MATYNPSYSEWIWSSEHNKYYCAVYDGNGRIVEYQWQGGFRQPVTPSVQQQPSLLTSAPQQLSNDNNTSPSSFADASTTQIPRSFHHLQQQQSQPDNVLAQQFSSLQVSGDNAQAGQAGQAEQAEQALSQEASSAAFIAPHTSDSRSYAASPPSHYTTSPATGYAALGQSTNPTSAQSPYTAPGQSHSNNSKNSLHARYDSASQPSISRYSPAKFTGTSQGSYYSQSQYQYHAPSQTSHTSQPASSSPQLAHYTSPRLQNARSVQPAAPPQPDGAQPLPGTSSNQLPESIRNTVFTDNIRRHIQSGDDGINYETLHPSFKRVRLSNHARFFRQGRVFKMLWTEPAGQVAMGQSRGSTHYSVVQFQEGAWSEIRRFVVIQNKGTFSQCIPIQTYRNQGATKPGLVIADHAIIYTGLPGSPPPGKFEGEDEIVKRPLRVHSPFGETLNEASRINFGKPYAVEHNVKLAEIGMIAEEHLHLLATYFLEAMGFGSG